MNRLKLKSWNWSIASLKLYSMFILSLPAAFAFWIIVKVKMLDGKTTQGDSNLRNIFLYWFTSILIKNWETPSCGVHCHTVEQITGSCFPHGNLLQPEPVRRPNHNFRIPSPHVWRRENSCDCWPASKSPKSLPILSTITVESWHSRGQDGGDRPTANWRENPWTGATGESWIIHQERSQVRHFFIRLSAVHFPTAYQYIIIIADPLIQTCWTSQSLLKWPFYEIFPPISFPQHRSIIKRVTALEYKLHRLILSKEDFTAYVQVHQHN